MSPEIWKLATIEAIKRGTTATEVVVGALGKELESSSYCQAVI